MAADVALAVGGELCGTNSHLAGVSFDSRTILPGQLFVPIIDQRDGHDFIADALNRGAGAYLTMRGDQGRTAIKVADTIVALQKLGQWARKRLDDQLEHRVIAITGSVGKTSTKDFVAAGLSASLRTHANELSFNNDFGLPATILNAPDDVQAMVLEMGMRGFGEIARLCQVALPEIGIVTRVADAHTERVGSIEGVIRAKRELIECLPSDGFAILNADDPNVLSMSRATSARTITFGEANDADVKMIECEIDAQGFARAKVITPWGQTTLSMKVPGRHMAQNAMAALCVVGVLGQDLNIASDAISMAEISPARMQLRTLKSGAVVLDDSYNANPTSMRVALETLSKISADRRIAFCGLMAELADPQQQHEAISAYAKSLDIKLFAVDTPFYGVDPISFAEARNELQLLRSGDTALIKGSKVAGLVKLCDGL